MAHALKKGLNEDLARKRLLRLGAEVHRDVKPRNILVGRSGRRAQTAVQSPGGHSPRDQSGNAREVRSPPRVSGKDVEHRPILRAELGHGPQMQRNSPR